MVLAVGFWVVGKVCKVLTAFLKGANLEAGVISFFNSIVKFSLRLTLFISALSILGFDVTSIIAAVGASLVTIGLALKDVLSNFASGILIIVNKHIRVGDYIEFENLKGTVSKIETTFTTLQSDENKTVIIPNSRLTANNIVRKSSHDVCKTSIRYVFSPDTKETQIRRIFRQALLSDGRILEIPPAEIKCSYVENGNLEVTLEAWSEKLDREGLKADLKAAADSLLKKRRIEIVGEGESEERD